MAERTGNRYRMGRRAKDAVEAAVQIFVSGLDSYPIKSATEDLIQLIISSNDENVSLSEVQATLRQKMAALFARLSVLTEWEYLSPVSGMYAANQPVDIGHCRFQKFTQADFLLWMQRISTGKYSPPSNAPLSQLAANSLGGFGGEPILLDQITACVRVHAADADHARVLGKAILEETLNLWRYAQIAQNGFERDFPELRVSPPPNWSHFDLCAPTDENGFCGVSTNSEAGRAAGCSFQTVRTAPGWLQLAATLNKPRSTRSELENKINTALLWFGNAALASADAVRLVSLVTALEALLLLTGTSTGKRLKLIRRTAALLPPELADPVDEIYTVRSKCVHDGQHIVESRLMAAASAVASECIGKLVTEARFANFKTLREVLTIIDPNLAEDSDNGE